MYDVLNALFGVAFFFFLHLIFFRLGWVRYEVHRLLMVLFLIFSFLSLFLLTTAPTISFERGFAVRLPMSALLLYFLLALTYVGQVIVLCYGSPSLQIINRFLKYGVKELTDHDLATLFSNEELIGARLKDLCQNGHVTESKGRFSITPKGQFVWNLVRAYRRLLGREIGG